MRARVRFAFLLVLIPVALSAQTRFVANGGVDAPDCSNPGAPCATINFAISQANPGDTISVAAGVYPEPAGPIIVNKSLIIQGAQSGVSAAAIPTRGGPESIVQQTFQIFADGVTIDGFTISPGAVSEANMLYSGINSGAFSGETFTNNIITGNVSGIYINSPGTPPNTISQNYIVDNNFNLGVAPGSGNGLHSDGGLSNTAISGNRIENQQNVGVFVYFVAGANNQIVNNNFPLVVADQGNAIHVHLQTNTNIQGNTITNNGPFSSIVLGGGNTNVTVADNIVTGGQGAAIRILDAGFGSGVNNLVNVISNTLVNNERGVAIGNPGDPAVTVTPEVHFNRIVNNTTADLITYEATTPMVDAENNWWGCNAGPATCAVITAASPVDSDPWLVMDILASPSTITVQQTSAITVDFNQNSAGMAIAGPDFFPENTAIDMSATNGGVTPDPAFTVNGSASSTFTPAAVGPATVSGTLDDETVTANIVVTLVPTTTALGSAPNPSTVGQTVTFTATVTPAAATGTVEFREGATVLGTSPVVAGTATFMTAALTAGTHNITAVYSGDATYATSTSNTVMQVVNQGTPTVTLTSMPNPSVPGQQVTFTATLPSTATGTVQFRQDGTPTGAPVVVTGGQAQLTTTFFVAGTYNIDAVYSGDANFIGATSNVVMQVVAADLANIPTLSPWMLLLLGATLAAAALLVMKR